MLSGFQGSVWLGVMTAGLVWCGCKLYAMRDRYKVTPSDDGRFYVVVSGEVAQVAYDALVAEFSVVRNAMYTDIDEVTRAAHQLRLQELTIAIREVRSLIDSAR